MESRLADPHTQLGGSTALDETPADQRAPPAPDPGLGRRRPRDLIAWAILALPVVLVAVPFWPGRMNADTLAEILSLKTGVYTNQYCPILQALWRPLYNIGMGPGWVLTGQVLVFVAGTFLLLRLMFKPRGAAVATCLICLTPQVYGELGLVGRDTWFVALFVACCACTSRALTGSGRARTLRCASALVLAWLTMAARQNAATSLVVPLGVLAVAWLLGRRRSRGRIALAAQALLIGVVTTVVMYGSQSLVNRALNVQNTHPAGQLYMYDLASMSRLDHRDYLPQNVWPQGSAAALDTLTSTAEAFGLVAGPHHPIRYPFSAAAADSLGSRWRHEILSHPVTYLRERLTEMGWTLGLTHDQVVIYHPYIDGNPFGYSNAFPWADTIANHYMEIFGTQDPLGGLFLDGGILFAPWIFLLICLGAVSVSVRRHSPASLAAGALGLAVVAYQVGLFFGLMGPNYRYEFPCIAIAEIIVALALGHAWQHTRRRKPGRSAARGREPVGAST